MLESPVKKMSKRRPSEKMVVPCINEVMSSVVINSTFIAIALIANHYESVL